MEAPSSLKGKVLFEHKDGEAEKGEDPAEYFKEGGQGDTDILEIALQTEGLKERIGAVEVSMKFDEDSELPDFPTDDDAEMEGVGGGEEEEDTEDEDYAPDGENETDEDSAKSVTPVNE